MAKLARSLVFGFCNSFAFRWLSRAAELLPLNDGNTLGVLTYHRVDTPDSRPDLDPSLISATPIQFERQMEWLAKNFETVSLSDVLDAVRQESSLPKRSVLVTFDDACRDFAENCWSILKAKSIPVSLFVPTGYPDQENATFWWDRLYCSIVRSERSQDLETPWGVFSTADDDARLATFKTVKRKIKQLPHQELLDLVAQICSEIECETPKSSVMGWSQLIELAKDGVDLVPHTHNHPLITRIGLEEAKQEISRSRELLEEKIGSRVLPAFAFPSGYFNENVTNLIKEMDFEMAFTTLRGCNDLARQNPLTMRRINVGKETPDELVRFQLSPLARAYRGSQAESYPSDC